MARGALAISFGAVFAALIVLLTLGTLAAVAGRAEGLSELSGDDWKAIRFTLWQALVSATLSVVFAIPVARALARRRFPGRSLIIALLGAPFILPTIVAILGLIAVFGQSGFVSAFLGLFGIPPVQIYGAHGVILAHVFFNLPLATRLLVQAWLAVPAEQHRIAESLSLSRAGMWRAIELPLLRETLPGAFLVIFLLCTTSFAVALALGGGPRATTVELAIYEAFRFDFDLGRAARLGLIQVAICAVIALLSIFVTVPQARMGGLDGTIERWDRHRREKWADGAAITFAILFLITPLAILTARGVPFLLELPTSIWTAAFTSLWVALASTLVVIVASLSLAISAQRFRRGEGLGDALSTLILATSPLVMGTGLFIMLFPFTNPIGLALPVTIAVNAVLSIPFVLRVLMPALRGVEEAYGPLADSLGLTGWARLRWLLLPRLRRPLSFAAGLAAALSMGDLGVIALFSNPDQQTLPLAMYQLMGAYRLEQAASAGLVLVALSFGIFFAIDQGGRADADF
ncbi:MAG: thiamine/thiamine pyrophosphate ABC transporter permease ThiP [Rhodobacteraceae bacterium]|nr:thiamine/thiamine pyrophosphate ABC transporter permease ThiP [Paracoccaceae bacterium]